MYLSQDEKNFLLDIADKEITADQLFEYEQKHKITISSLGHKFNSIDEKYNSFLYKIQKSASHNKLYLLLQIREYNNLEDINKKIQLFEKVEQKFDLPIMNMSKRRIVPKRKHFIEKPQRNPNYLPIISHKKREIKSSDLTIAFSKLEFIDFYLQHKDVFESYFAADFFSRFFFTDQKFQEQVFVLKSENELSISGEKNVYADTIQNNIDLKPVVEKIAGFSMLPDIRIYIYNVDIETVTLQHFIHTILPAALDFLSSHYSIYLFPELLKRKQILLNSYIIPDLINIIQRYEDYDPARKTYRVRADFDYRRSKLQKRGRRRGWY